MRNHNEKIRDMARSVLPSSRRKGARADISYAKRRNRTKVRQALHEWAKYDDPYEFCGFADYDYIYGYGEDQNIKMAVSARRDGDKLSVVRWAQRLCETDLADLSEEEKYAWFKRAMPDNLIGRHALGHIKSEIAPTLDCLHRGSYSLRWLAENEDGEIYYMTDEERWARADAQRAAERNRRYEKCRLIINTRGAQSRFNTALKEEHARHKVLCHYIHCVLCPTGPRLLLGFHDIDDFLEAINKGYSPHSPAGILDAFII